MGDVLAVTGGMGIAQPASGGPGVCPRMPSCMLETRGGHGDVPWGGGLSSCAPVVAVVAVVAVMAQASSVWTNKPSIMVLMKLPPSRRTL